MELNQRLLSLCFNYVLHCRQFLLPRPKSRSIFAPRTEKSFPCLWRQGNFFKKFSRSLCNHKGGGHAHPPKTVMGVMDLPVMIRKCHLFGTYTLEAIFYNKMRYINLRFTYLHTCTQSHIIVDRRLFFIQCKGYIMVTVLQSHNA